ncbi:MAG TPA: hypothetical protein VM029_15110, partial [Opitutaceae bacterium]|nr:hypothetical protein [Opitutaceae bacterium]
MQRRIVLAALIALGSAWSAGVQAQSAWRPDKPIEIVTSSAAGGSNDQIARVMQNIIQGGKLTPTPVSVVNKPGGNQTIAPTYLNMQPGDGHYLLLA